MEELIANLEEDIDLLLYDSKPSNIEKKIATDITKVISIMKKCNLKLKEEEQERKKDILIYPLVALNSWTCRYCLAKIAQGQKVCSCCGYGIRWD